LDSGITRSGGRGNYDLPLVGGKLPDFRAGDATGADAGFGACKDWEGEQLRLHCRHGKLVPEKQPYLFRPRTIIEDDMSTCAHGVACSERNHFGDVELCRCCGRIPPDVTLHTFPETLRRPGNASATSEVGSRLLVEVGQGVGWRLLVNFADSGSGDGIKPKHERLNGRRAANVDSTPTNGSTKLGLSNVRHRYALSLIRCLESIQRSRSFRQSLLVGLLDPEQLALVGYIWTRMQIDAQIRMIRASDPKVPIGDLSR
jgi:hypothetical protein